MMTSAKKKQMTKKKRHEAKITTKQNKIPIAQQKEFIPSSQRYIEINRHE